MAPVYLKILSLKSLNQRSEEKKEGGVDLPELIKCRSTNAPKDRLSLNQRKEKCR